MDETQKQAHFWVDQFQLQPHPEGGFYKETYRSSESVQVEALPQRFTGSRSIATGIYYLLESGQFSAFHRIRSDEMWHFYAGHELTIYVLLPDGQLTAIRLGADPIKGQVFQAVVPAGCWFASRVEPGQSYALVGCTVAPGFDFADFEMAERQDLIQTFPQHQQLITELTREGEV
ncbi:MAG: cupin domain-containing protein [Salibacteraceae bacterium]